MDDRGAKGRLFRVIWLIALETIFVKNFRGHVNSSLPSVTYSLFMNLIRPSKSIFRATCSVDSLAFLSTGARPSVGADGVKTFVINSRQKWPGTALNLAVHFNRQSIKLDTDKCLPSE